MEISQFFVQHLLKYISVELFLAIAQKLANHLSAEAFSLQEEVCNTNRGIRNESTLNQILYTFLRFPM